LFRVEVFREVKIGPLGYQFGLREKLIRNNFDVCIVFLDIRLLSSLNILFLPVAKMTITWGAWFTRSLIANQLRKLAISKGTSSIFYCQKHLNDAREHGIVRDKLYVAPNTIAVPNPERVFSGRRRDSIIFVGTFSKRKGLDRLVRIFSTLIQGGNRSTKLLLVGDGPERSAISNLVANLGLVDCVEMPGKLNDPDELQHYYARAIVSVSLTQAGLSVLQSMGHGVPFLTVCGSISGGESLNIVNGLNGLLTIDSDEAICEAIRTLLDNPERAQAMGDAAKKHYLTYATIENYAQGFIDAIEGTRLTTVWDSEDQNKRSGCKHGDDY
jgi:glycosyltransferase involved in cell wall biosynthesis